MEKRTLSKEEFESQANLPTRYEMFRDEYGDACGSYWDYLDVHYNDYLNGWLYTELP